MTYANERVLPPATGTDTFGNSAELSDPCTFPIWQGGVFFPGMIPPSGMVKFKCVVDIKPGDSSWVIGYQVDDFTHTL